MPATAVAAKVLPDAAGSWCLSGWSPARDESPGHDAGTRTRSLNRALRRRRVLRRQKPRLSLRLPGALWLRFADRQLRALLFQLPPR